MSDGRHVGRLLFSIRKQRQDFGNTKGRSHVIGFAYVGRTTLGQLGSSTTLEVGKGLLGFAGVVEGGGNRARHRLAVDVDSIVTLRLQQQGKKDDQSKRWKSGKLRTAGSVFAALRSCRSDFPPPADALDGGGGGGGGKGMAAPALGGAGKGMTLKTTRPSVSTRRANG